MLKLSVAKSRSNGAMSWKLTSELPYAPQRDRNRIIDKRNWGVFGNLGAAECGSTRSIAVVQKAAVVVALRNTKKEAWTDAELYCLSSSR